VYNRHRRWSGDGAWENILDRLRAGSDEAEVRAWTVAADATIVRAHRHVAGRGMRRRQMLSRHDWRRLR
jgi:transposase